MTAKQIEKRVKRLWKTQQQAADALGVRQQSISHWCRGARPVPLWLVKFLECLETADKIGKEAGL
jgi:DNA-binding XRE family transcriptional regulator